MGQAWVANQVGIQKTVERALSTFEDWDPANANTKVELVHRQVQAVRSTNPPPADLAQTLTDAGYLMEEIGEYQEAITFHTEAKDLVLQGANARQRATVYHNLGRLLTAENRLEEADTLLARALRLRTTHLEAGDLDLDKTHLAVAVLRRLQGQFDASIDLSLAVRASRGPDRVGLQADNNRGQVLWLQNRPGEARQVLWGVLTQLESHSISDGSLLRAETQFVLAQVLSLADEPSALDSPASPIQADSLLQEATTFYEGAFKPDHPKVATLLQARGRIYEGQRNYEAAIPLFEQAVAIREVELRPGHPRLTNSLNSLAYALRQTDRPDEALAIYEAIMENPAPDPATATAMYNMAGLLRSTDPDRALGLYLQAVPILQHGTHQERSTSEPLPSSKPGNSTSLAAHADSAETVLREALAIRSELFEAQNWRISSTMSILGEAVAVQGRCDKAQELLQEGYAGLLAALGEEDRRTKEAAERLRAGCEVDE